jgi:hypothetical protein
MMIHQPQEVSGSQFGMDTFSFDIGTLHCIESGLENSITASGIRRADHATPLYAQKLELTSPTSGGRSVGIVHSWTEATLLLLLFFFIFINILFSPIFSYSSHFLACANFVIGLWAVKFCT